MKNKNNKSTTHVCGNKNINNRNCKSIDNSYNNSNNTNE